MVDEFPAAEKKVAALAKATTIPPVLEAAKSAGTLRAVEFAQTRDSKLTAPLTHQVADKAEQLLDSALLSSSTRVATISEAAQQLTIVAVSHVDKFTRKPYITQETRRQGPSAEESQYLQQTQATCDKVSATAKDLAEALDSEYPLMEAVAAKADVLKLRVHDILSDNYWVVPNP